MKMIENEPSETMHFNYKQIKTNTAMHAWIQFFTRCLYFVVRMFLLTLLYLPLQKPKNS